MWRLCDLVVFLELATLPLICYSASAISMRTLLCDQTQLRCNNGCALVTSPNSKLAMVQGSLLIYDNGEWLSKAGIGC